MPATLADIIADVESGNNELAMRFEPTRFMTWTRLYKDNEPLLARITRANKCSAVTARMIASTSWGVFQILGENLYRFCGVVTPITLYLTSGRAAQEISFQEFLAHAGYKTDATLLSKWDDRSFVRFARIYNGPGDAAANRYAARMKDAKARLDRVAVAT